VKEIDLNRQIIKSRHLSSAGKDLILLKELLLISLISGVVCMENWRSFLNRPG